MKKFTKLSFIALLTVSMVSCGGGCGEGNDDVISKDETKSNIQNQDVNNTHESHDAVKAEHHNMGSKIEASKNSTGIVGTFVLAVHENHEILAGTKMYFDGKSKVSFEEEKYTTYKVKGTHVQIDMEDYQMVFLIKGDTLTLVDTVGTLIYVKHEE